MHRRILLALFVAGALWACGDTGTPVSPEPTGAARLTDDILGELWVLEAFVAADSALEAAVAGTHVTLRLAADGTVEGQGGCNGYGGTWTADEEGQLAIEGLTWTEMACAEPEGVMAQELRFLEALGAARQVRRFSDILRVDYGTDGEHLRLSRVVREEAPPEDFTEMGWELRSFQRVLGDAIEVQTVLPGARVTATFLADGHVRGRTGCNDWRATWGVAAERAMDIDSVSVTEKACLEPEGVMDQEARFLDAVSRVVRFESVPEQLLLYTDDDRILEFGPALADTVAGTIRDSLALPDDRSLGWTVSACTYFFAPPENRVRGRADAVTFDYVLDSFCTVNEDGRIELAAKVEPPRIVLTATYRGPQVRCQCPIPVRGTLEGLEAGTWSVELWQADEIDGQLQPPTQVDARRVVVGGDSTATAAVDIRGGTSFGECRGYCWNELRLDGESIELVSRGWDLDAYPEKLLRRQLEPGLWERLRHLDDVAAIYGLADRIGCPDCADGGAEWIEVTTAAGHKRVLFEHGRPPEALAELADALTRLRRDLLAELEDRTVVE